MRWTVIDAVSVKNDWCTRIIAATLNPTEECDMMADRQADSLGGKKEQKYGHA
jgi:hypothetical protein